MRAVSPDSKTKLRKQMPRRPMPRKPMLRRPVLRRPMLRLPASKHAVELSTFFDEAKIDRFWHRRRGRRHLYGAIFGLLVSATRPEMGIFGLVKKNRAFDKVRATDPGSVPLWFGASCGSVPLVVRCLSTFNVRVAVI